MQKMSDPVFSTAMQHEPDIAAKRRNDIATARRTLQARIDEKATRDGEDRSSINPDEERMERAAAKRAFTAARVAVERLVEVDRILTEKERRVASKASADMEKATAREARQAGAQSARDEKEKRRVESVTRKAERISESTAKREDKQRRIEIAREGRANRDRVLNEERTAKDAKREALNAAKIAEREMEVERRAKDRQARVDRDEARSMQLSKRRQEKGVAARAKSVEEVDGVKIGTRAVSRVHTESILKAAEKKLQEVTKMCDNADRLYDEYERRSSTARLDLRRTSAGDDKQTARRALEAALKVTNDQVDVVDALYEEREEAKEAVLDARSAVHRRAQAVVV